MSEFDVNLLQSKKYLNRFAEAPTGHFINGKPFMANNAQTYENISPVDNTSLGHVVRGTSEDMDKACEAAQAAFPAWRDVSGNERKKILHHFADMVEKRAEEIALVESIDCGQPIRFMKQAAIRGAANFRFFCG
ncbi:aldehyde dehydrogenase family protein [Oceanospirillaceae bacterium]|nr:aldehyde dehydrogenase family protein [Oceanospirillaceae bacterium]